MVGSEGGWCGLLRYPSVVGYGAGQRSSWLSSWSTTSLVRGVGPKVADLAGGIKRLVIQNENSVWSTEDQVKFEFESFLFLKFKN